MSYNISHLEVIVAEGLRIPRAHLDALRDANEGQYPENNPFDEWPSRHNYGDRKSWVESEDTGIVRLCSTPACFPWTGEWSGRSWDLLKQVLASFDGSADLVAYWEEGDSLSGLRLRNHVVTEHDVVVSLGRESKR